jgi:hypothetical protein
MLVTSSTGYPVDARSYLPVDVSPDFVQVAAALGSLDVHQHYYPLTLELLVVHFQHQVWLAVRERMRHYNKLGPGGKSIFDACSVISPRPPTLGGRSK